MNAKHRAYLQEQADAAAALVAAKAAEVRRLQAYVKDRLGQIAEHSDYDNKQQIFREMERLRIREQERLERREMRYKKYMECEREHLMYEDNRSYKLRDYNWQVVHEHKEQMDMLTAEMEQTEVDRFWGVDLYERKQNEEEERLRKAYERKVHQLNQMMVRTGAVLRPLHKAKIPSTFSITTGKDIVMSSSSSALITKRQVLPNSNHIQDSSDDYKQKNGKIKQPLFLSKYSDDSDDDDNSGNYIDSHFTADLTYELKKADIKCRELLMKKLKAEEIRQKLKIRLFRGYV